MKPSRTRSSGSLVLDRAVEDLLGFLAGECSQEVTYAAKGAVAGAQC